VPISRGRSCSSIPAVSTAVVRSTLEPRHRPAAYFFHPAPCSVRMLRRTRQYTMCDVFQVRVWSKEKIIGRPIRRYEVPHNGYILATSHHARRSYPGYIPMDDVFQVETWLAVLQTALTLLPLSQHQKVQYRCRTLRRCRASPESVGRRLGLGTAF